MGLLHIILDNVKLVDVLIGLSVITCSYVIYFYYRHFNRVNPFPGPIPIPLIGSFAIFMEDIDAWFFRLNKKYGKEGIYELNIAGNRQIVITRAEYIDKFMANDASAHLMRTANNGLLDLFDLEVKGVGLNHSYKHWKFNRSAFSTSIMPLSLTNKPSKILNKLFGEMSNYWVDMKQVDEDGAVIDVAAWMRRFTTDFISLLTSDKRIAAMYYYNQKINDEPMTKDVIESEKFVECINTFAAKNQLLFIPKILRNLPFIKHRVDALLDNNYRLYGKLVDIIRKRRREIEKVGLELETNEKNETNRLDLLTSLIITNTKDDPHPQKNVDPELARPMTDDEIRGIMFDAFVAGTDTTVNTFCFALYYITHHPEVKKKLLKEIESVCGNDPTRPIMLEDLDKLRYVEAIIKETSRIRPTVSMVSRYSSRPDTMGGYQWPSNTLFIMYVRGVNNNPLYWKDPEKFDPERFYQNQEIRKNAFSMFGGGPRICLGRKIAMIELKTLLTSVYRKFDVELMDMHAPLQVETSTITVCKELKIKVIPRERVQVQN